MARLISVVVAALLITVGAAACGSGGGAGAKVSASAYMTAVCTAVGRYEKDSTTDPLAGSKTLTPAAGKQKLTSWIGRISADTDTMVPQLRAAGYPDVANGRTDAAAVVKTYSALQAAMTRAKAQVKQLSTASAAAFEAGTTKIGTMISQAVSADSSGLDHLDAPALTAAADKIKACRSLESS